MAVAHLPYERGRKQTLELDSIEGSSVFTSSFEWMLGGIEISGLSNDRGSRGLLRGRGTRKRFDFLFVVLVESAHWQKK